MPTANKKVKVEPARKAPDSRKEFFGTYRPNEDLNEILDLDGRICGGSLREFSRETGLPFDIAA